MRIVKKNVYYCEFCKKKGLSAGHMNAHEKSCTGNMQRVCKMCIDKQPNYSTLVEKYKGQMELKETVSSDDFNDYHVFTAIRKPKLDDIAEDCSGCPACILTVLRGCGLCGHEWEIDFDFKGWTQEWWANKPRGEEW